MKEAYENKGTETFLVCELQPNDQLEGNSLRTLASGKLQGFAAASFSQVGTTKYIHYDVTGKIPFFRMMKEPVSKKVLLCILEGIANALLSMEANQVDPCTIILDPAHVFVNALTGETAMICMPLIAFRPGQNAGMLYSFILANARLNSGEDSGFVTKLKDFLGSNPDPAPAVLKAELKKAEAAESAAAAVVIPPVVAVPEPPAQPVQQPQPRTDGPMSMFRLLDHHQEQEAKEREAREQAAREQAAREQAAREQAAREQAAREQAAREQAAREQAAREQAAREQAAREQAEREREARKKMSAPKGDFAVPGMPEIPVPAVKQEPAQAPKRQLDFPIPGKEEKSAPEAQKVESSVNPEETTLVEAGEVSAAHAYLVRVKTGERAPITKPFFRIGKEQSYVDYFISGNSAISRAHAYIVNKDGQYFLVDTHSTNHTYINGGMISPDVETRLFHGAKVHFANEEFEFKLH